MRGPRGRRLPRTPLGGVRFKVSDGKVLGQGGVKAVMTRLTVLLALALVAPTLSGCLGATASTGNFTRDILVDADEDVVAALLFSDEMGDVLATLFDVTFVYTHQSATPLSVEGVTAHYTDPMGENVTLALSNATEQTQLRQGDTVRLPGAGLLSDVTLQRGNKVLAERGHAPRDWLDVEASPAPISVGSEGKATYNLTLSGGLTLTMDRTSFVHQEEGAFDCYLDEGDSIVCESEPGRTLKTTFNALAFSGNVTANGNATLSTDVRPRATTMGVVAQFQAGMGMNLTIDVDQTVTSEGNTTRLQYDLGLLFDSAFNASVDTSVDVQEGRATSGRTTAQASGYANATAFGHLDGYRFEIEENRTEFSESVANHSVSFALGERDVVASTLLSRLWNMSLEPGDRLRVQWSAAGIQTVLETEVVARENRDVGGRSLPTLRVRSTSELRYVDDGVDELLQATEDVMWLSAKTHLPVYGESAFVQSFNERDLLPLVRAMEILPEDVVLPTSIGLVMYGNATLVWSGADVLYGPAILGLGGASLLPVVVLSTLPLSATIDD